MIKRVVDSKFPLIVNSPTGVYEKEYFKTVFEAGGLPVLDTEFMAVDSVKKAIEELSSESLLFGVRTGISNGEILSYIKENPAVNLNAIILTYFYPEELDNVSVHSGDAKLFIEATDVGILEKIEKLSPDAIIVKGIEGPGKVSNITSFVLMQWYLKESDLPVFVHGGVGMHTSAGMFAAGASGIVLDNQLYLADDCPVTDNFKALIRTLDEGDSAIVGRYMGVSYSFFKKLGTKIIKDLKETEAGLDKSEASDKKLYDEIKKNINFVNDSSVQALQALVYMGQDGIFAKHFARHSSTVKGMINELFANVGSYIAAVDEFDPMKADTALALEHGTKYPIIQGPMANVSDTAEFAKLVNEQGALPFFALGSLPTHLAEDILKKGSEKVSRFGAGLVGIEAFNKCAKEHIDLAKKYKAPFALFAGGIPAQVNELEKNGVKTYLHTPSIQMLENAIKNSCTRFIFEGNEAGGHIGTLTSMVLWEKAIEAFMSLGQDNLSCHTMIFAGGISSCHSSHFISGMTSILASKGMKIGVQLGTPYLFTEEIVETGAIQKLYRDVMLKPTTTTVMGNSVGLSSRTIESPFSLRTIQEEQERIKQGMSLKDRKEAFEKNNIGALLIAGKGFTPVKGEDGNITLQKLNNEEQFQRGNYMTGDSIAFHNEVITIKDIHSKIIDLKAELHRKLNELEVFTSPQCEMNDEVAIIGIGCVYPDAPDTDTFWNNILDKKYSIDVVPQDRFDSSLYFDKDKKAEDKSYTEISATIKDYKFDFKKFGYKKEESLVMSRSQKMILEAAVQAVENAGYNKDEKMIPGNRTSVIIGSCLSNELSDDLILKYYYPEMKHYLDQVEEFKNLSEDDKNKILENLKNTLANAPEPKHPDAAAINVEAARIAKHIGAHGAAYTVDAACATSFTAVDNAVIDLLMGEADMVVTGGLQSLMSPETFIGFASMGALSADGSFPFDERAGGFVLGEGAGAVVLKRVKDALRDGDKIHAIIKGVGASSDGKGKAIAAPKSEGQMTALQRAYENMKDKVSPDEIEYIEAHGTSTLMGDYAEVETIKKFYGKSKAKIGVSSVKSQIGHLLGGAGMAGFIKATMALDKKTLPPNGQFAKLSPRFNFDGTSIGVIADAAEWQKESGKARYAAISSFGFGGINYHLVLSDYSPESYKPLQRKIFSDLNYNFNDNRIVVAGLGVMLPGATSIDEFWNNIKNGKSVISEIPESRFHIESYINEKDPAFKLPKIKSGILHDFTFNNLQYRIPPAAAMSIDRNQIFALEASKQAIEQAGIKDLLTQNGNRIGAIVGTTTSEKHYENIFRVRTPYLRKIINSTEGVDKTLADTISAKLEEQIRARYPKNNEDTTPGLLTNIVTGRMANFYNLNALNYTVEAECASSGVAVFLAMKELKCGHSDFILCGGVDTNLSPARLKAYDRIKVLNPGGDNKFFDKDAQGLVMSEGCAILVLTTYKQARENKMNVMAELNGATFSNYANENILSPTTSSLSKVIKKHYSKIPVRKDSIEYVDLFAASHPLVDSWERDAIDQSFSQSVHAGNIKSETGYFRSANPSVALTKLILMSKNRTILPNFSYDEKTSIIGKDSKIAPLKEAVSKAKGSMHLGINFAGLGGTAGHATISTLPEWIGNVQLQSADDLRDFTEEVANPKPGTFAVLVTGQGAQYPYMMQDLYNSNALVKEYFDRGEKVFREMRGYSLLEIMFNQDKKLNLTENTQPAIYLASAVIYEIIKRQGFKDPDYFIGHSLGECSALFCAGILSFEDTLRLIIRRSELMKEDFDRIPGQIMVIFKSADESNSIIKESGISGVWVANKNSESQTAISGKSAEINQFCEYLTSKDISFRKLPLSGAFHTPLLEEASKKFHEFLKTLKFNNVDYTKVISNVTATPYPQDEAKIKELLTKQLTLPVEFIKSIKFLDKAGVREYIEVGPQKLLANLLGKIDINEVTAMASQEPKKGQKESLQAFLDYLASKGRIQAAGQVQTAAAPAVKQSVPVAVPVHAAPAAAAKQADASVSISAQSDDRGFQDFLNSNDDKIKEILFKEYQKEKREKALKALEDFNFSTEKVVIAGTAIGLPGTANKVFDASNFDKIIGGTNMIEPLTEEDKERMVAMNITKVFKKPDGSAQFVEITDKDEVIQLAGRLGHFNLKNEYDIDAQLDLDISLGIAAGIEALKDANIPLVLSYKTTSTGKKIPDGFSLPEEMQNTTGVIFTSLFSGWETLISKMNKFYYNKFFVNPYEEIEDVYYAILESVKDKAVKEKITEWFFKIKERKQEYREFKFDRSFVTNISQIGAPQFAQLIKAKGPATQIMGACASTTHAVGMAEDWIRTGRCERVIIIGAESATSKYKTPWVGSGFLSVGAATIKKVVTEAALPFDKNRNGMIIGAGAVGMVIERSDVINDRGMNGQAEILGTFIGNSAFHPTKIDVDHVSDIMIDFIRKAEKRHNLDRSQYTKKLLFMSHETYTPARGGSADSEVKALKKTFPGEYRDITITNTKGYTGHTLGAGIEDPVMVKALQMKQAPPIANLREIPDEFADLKFNRGTGGDYEYGLHFAAGFGSHFGMLFIRRLQENSTSNNTKYYSWLQRIAHKENPQLVIRNNTLCIDAEPGTPAVQPAPVHASAAPAAVQAASPASMVPKVKEIIAELTGYTTDMLDENLDLEADLGIDTVKQVEIFGKVAGNFGVAVPEDLKLSEMNTIAKLGEYIAANTTVAAAPAQASAAPAAVQSASPASMIPKVKEIIAELTGYTTDMLDENLDLEADLGIDTVKQVEIFGKVAGNFGVAVPEDLKLSEMNTIAKLGEYIAANTTVATAPAQAAAAPAAVQAASPASMVPKVKEIIAELTGYTTDMLDENLDLEADLGIDTVKQVEIFGKVAGNFGMDVPEDLQLSQMNTIAKLAEFIAANTTVAAAPAQASAAPAAVQAASPASMVPKVKEIISELTGYTTDMLDENLDLEADLGIDTVKQVEIFGKVAGNFGMDVPEDLQLSQMNTIAKLAEFIAANTTVAAAPAQTSAAPAAAQAASPASMIPKVKEIISELTGYTTDMLDENLDLEADLGIDTVKQVEIFGKVAGNFGIDVPEDLQLSEMNTIAKLAGYIAANTTVSAAPAQASAAPAAVQAASPASMIPKVKEIISELTGYTTDMLDENLDLEADLGIDTVKQVEIFGKVAGNFGIDVPEDLQLSEMNTIAKLAGYIASNTTAAPAPSAPAETAVSTPAPAAAAAPAEEERVKRLTVGVKKTAIGKAIGDFSGKTFIATKDKNGFAEKIIKEIKSLNGKVITVGEKGSDIVADLTDMDAVEKAMKDAVAKDSSINSILHLEPLNMYFGGKDNDFKTLDRYVKTMFIMINTLFENVKTKDSIITSMSFDSVVFPYSDNAKLKITPVFAGLSGMMKTVNKELRDALVKIVDFNWNKPKDNADAIAKAYVTELLSGDRRVETGITSEGEKYTLNLKIEPNKETGSFVKDGDTIVVSGGGGGITFEIMNEVCNTYKDLKLIILDYSDLSTLEEEFKAPGVTEAQILASLKEKMTGAKPLEIKNAVGYRMMLKQKIENVKHLETKATVYYHATDVSDTKVISDALSKYDKIDGVLHAAGVELSQILPKKTLDSFNREFNTKVYGIYNILDALKDKDYKYFLTFSSVTARFGNEAQIGYTCANDFIGKVLLKEKLAHKDRAYKVYAWTAWAGAGMATNETVKKVLEERGLEFLPLDRGIKYFIDDLRDSETPEMIFTGITESFDPDNIFPGDSDINEETPFLGPVLKQDDKSMSFTRVLDLKKDLFLYDHARFDVPIFLGSTGIETMAEAATVLMGKGKVITSLDGFRIPYGIKILKGRPKELEIGAVKVDGSTVKCNIISQFKNPKGMVMGDPTLHYEGTYGFSDKYEAMPKVTIPEFKNIEVKGDVQELIYHPHKLFMDNSFRTIEDVLSFDKDVLVTKMRQSGSHEFFKGMTDPNFVTNCIIVDSMFQTGGVYEMVDTSEIVLPYTISGMKFYSEVKRDKEFYCFTEKIERGADTNTYALKLVDMDGNLYISIDRFEMVKVDKVAPEFQIKDKLLK